ncbi:MAG: 4'-phosphopantetheinyl transferase superfamily protein [Cardiobacteriaceae bacterium]|nr:4'-phosphopantetheinyl transferase superfamily protein [Cardiobacteriaceae bacterium]
MYLLLIPEEFAKKYSSQYLEEADKIRLKNHQNLENRTSWQTSRYGKNIIKKHFLDLQFCLSHKLSDSLFAIDKNKPGVDLEFISQRDFLALSKRVFSEFEMQELARNNYSEEYFYRLWTLKESLIKQYNLSFPEDLVKIGLNTLDKIIWISGKINGKFIFSATFNATCQDEIIFYFVKELTISDLEIKGGENISFRTELLNI